MRRSLSAAAAAAILLVAGSAAAQTVTSFASGFSDLRGIAVDSSNNVLVNEVFASRVRRIPAGGGVPTLYATPGFPNEGITIAPSGDVYTSGANIYRFTAPGVGGVFATALPYSLGLDLTSTGLMYVIVGNEVHTVTSGGVRTPLVTAGLTQPYGIAISSADVVVVSDQTQNQVYRVNGDGSLSLYADFTALGRTPVGLVFRGPELYVVTRESDLYRVASMGATPTLFASLGGATTFDVAVQPDGAALYATHQFGDVDRISLPPLPPVVTVPTLTEWAMILFAALLAAAGALYLHRRAQAA